MRISDWSSDVCSSDLLTAAGVFALAAQSLRSGGTGVGRGLAASPAADKTAAGWRGSPRGTAPSNSQLLGAEMSYMENKVVLITGGGTGSGRAAAEVFAREGANVLITGRRASALEAVTSSNPSIQGFVYGKSVEQG